MDLTGCAESYAVDHSAVHPAYNYDLNDNDIAILVLTRAIDLNRKSCACPVCLSSRVPQPGEWCVVSGFGEESNDGRSKWRFVCCCPWWKKWYDSLPRFFLFLHKTNRIKLEHETDDFWAKTTNRLSYNQSINQSINQWNNQSINQAINQANVPLWIDPMRNLKIHLHFFQPIEVPCR